MCGLTGIYMQKKSADLRMRLSRTLALLQNLNEDRGTDSWGFYDGKKLVKDLGALGDVDTSRLLNTNFVMAHTRQATTGAKTVRNAHPFNVKGSSGHIIGAHNGMISNWSTVAAKNNWAGLEVDSEVIFHCLANGIPLSELNGYGTISWVNTAFPKDVFLCRISDSGQLAAATIGKDPDAPDAVIWSSSEGHLRKAMGVSGLEYEMIDIAPHSVYRCDSKGFWLLKEEHKIGTASYIDSGNGWSRIYDTGDDDTAPVVRYSSSDSNPLATPSQANNITSDKGLRKFLDNKHLLALSKEDQIVVLGALGFEIPPELSGQPVVNAPVAEEKQHP